MTHLRDSAESGCAVALPVHGTGRVSEFRDRGRGYFWGCLRCLSSSPEEEAYDGGEDHGHGDGNADADGYGVVTFVRRVVGWRGY